MSIFETALGWLTPAKVEKPEVREKTPRFYFAGLGGQRSRISTDTQTDSHFFASTEYIASPEDSLDTWRRQNLNDLTLSRISVSRLVELMTDVSPEVSRALWDFVLFCNPGWEITAQVVGGDADNPKGKKALDEMMDLLEEHYGSPDVPFSRMFIGAFLRGAFLVEIVLDDDGSFLDLVTPDPYAVRFKKELDPKRGVLWHLGQWQGGQWVDLEYPTISYIPLHPLPGNPYGRSVVGSAIFSCLFLIGLLHDLRRVVSQQGYPRLDLSISLEKLMLAMPGDLESDPEAVKAWVSDIIDEVSDVYSTLEPDEAYIHTDVVEINRPVGTVDSDSLGAIDPLLRSLERMITRALKTMPLLMGNSEASSETHANRQWEIHVAGIKSLQHYAESMLGRLFKTALRAQGIQADVTVAFSELRASERLRDAQTDLMMIANAARKRDEGWITQDEASMEVTGSLAYLPEPIVSAGGGFGDDGFTEGDGEGEEPEEAEVNSASRRRKRAVQIVPEGSELPLPDVPGVVFINDRDIELSIDLWDELMPGYEGLLEAAVVGREDFDDEDDNGTGLMHGPSDSLVIYSDGKREMSIRQGSTPLWEWDQRSKRYRHSTTGRYVGQRQMTELRDSFLDKQKERIFDEDAAGQLASGEISLQRWILNQREVIKQTFVDQYVMGKGGRNNMTQSDWGRVGRMCRTQYSFLQNFGISIAGGNQSVASIRNRSVMYINSSVQAFERGKAASYGDFTLPAHPADGRTRCKANCRCHWLIREYDDRWECFWKIDPAAENCDDCQDNARSWNPYIVQKSSAGDRKELLGHLHRLI